MLGRSPYRRATRPCWTTVAAFCSWTTEAGASRVRPTSGLRHRSKTSWTTRAVVGPDEPFGGRSHQDMEADHWAQLAGVLGGHGIAADARDLKRLPHDVVLSERLLARVGHDPNDAVQP